MKSVPYWSQCVVGGEGTNVRSRAERWRGTSEQGTTEYERRVFVEALKVHR